MDKFYFPVDFIILDKHPISNANCQISMILGHPFLATSSALINCRSGALKLSFGNMILELNIFNTCKQTRDEEDVHEVNLIETIVQDQTLETCLVNHVILTLMRILKLHTFIVSWNLHRNWK